MDRTNKMTKKRQILSQHDRKQSPTVFDDISLNILPLEPLLTL